MHAHSDNIHFITLPLQIIQKPYPGISSSGTPVIDTKFTAICRDGC